MVNDIIVMNRGDSLDFDVTIYDDNSETGYYYLQPGDVVYFRIMLPHQPFEEAIFKKEYTVNDTDPAGTLVVHLKHEDTVNMCPGVYYYSIKLHVNHREDDVLIDKVLTVINKTKFVIND